MLRGIRLNPHHPSSYPFHLGQCYFALARYQEAIAAFERGLEIAADTQRLRVWLAASYVRAARPEDAAWEAENILMANPHFSVEGLRWAVPFNLERAVGRRPGYVPGGAWQGTARRNSELLQRVVT
jgi:tetratricopeptide (TPR) repeat protein